MSSRLRISLVIPACNEESHLAGCLRAARAQSRQFDEIIVVDNGSTDGTVAIVAEFPEVRLLEEPRRGIVFARNRGFRAAKGDIIARIDADTLLPENWVAHVEHFYNDASHIRTAWTSGGRFYDAPLPGFVSWSYRLLAFRINALLTGYPTLWGSSMALPARLWQEVAGVTCQRTDIHEDLDLATHLREAGATLFLDSTMTVDAQLRRVWKGRRQLWNYLQWWPRTLRIHGQKSWLLCWVVGVVPLYVATFFLPSPKQKKTAVAQVPSVLEV